MTDYQSIIDRFYPEGLRLRDIYMRHCRSVADFALEIAANKGIELPELEAAAMLHDIGILMTDAPSIGCYGREPYIRHGILGARLLHELKSENDSQKACDWLEKMARVAERHTGAGISPEDIVAQKLPLDPSVNYMPESVLERLVCYADKFYSKSGSPRRKSLDEVKASMLRISPSTFERFMRLHEEFG